MLLKKRIPWPYVLGKIKYEMAIIGLYSTVFGLWHKDLNLHHIAIPLTVPAILGTVISLLLAFRSNQAYDRWWEARIVWGAIVNDSRTLIRQMQCFIKDPDFSVQVNTFMERFARRQIFWTHSLGQSLRGQNALNHAGAFIPEEEITFLKRHSNVPNAILSLHARDLRHAMNEDWLNAYQQVEIGQTITKLCDSMGKCERIKKTVFPTTYSLYIHFALYLFMILLPFGMTEYPAFIQIPLVVTIAAAFLLIEKMAIHLQDPFENKPTDTPVTAIALTITQDIRQMMNDQEIAERQKEIQPQEGAYYLL